MGERIPDQVGCNAEHEGCGYGHPARDSAEIEVSKLVLQSLLHADGKKSDNGFLDGRVKQP